MSVTTTVKPILLTEATKAILERGNYTKDKVNVPNSHKALQTDIEGIQALAAALNVDFDKTEHTFTVSKSANGVAVYSPYIGKNKDGEAAIYWGKCVVPLSTVAVAKTIDEVGKRLVMSFDVGEEEIQLSLMMPKENRADLPTLRKALKQGKLGEHLVQSFTKPKSLSELAPGEYQVIGYEAKDFNGDIKYTINVLGQGLFNTNTKLRRKLANNPTITEDQPATLMVQESVETTSTGYPIVPVDLTTVEDLEIPVFDFD